MLTKSLVLFLTPLLSGLSAYLFTRGRTMNFRLILVFAGSYLFSITIIHILPELFRQTIGMEYIGICVLAGFFFQQLLEYFTSGVEHGHMHQHESHDAHDTHAHVLKGPQDQTERSISALVLLTALCIHAFLEGAMLNETHAASAAYDVNAILIGIVLHRAPAAFALMMVLTAQLGNRQRALPHLIVFSLAAPLGLFVAEYLSEIYVLTESSMVLLYALVCGNFLHISTTIVYESSPEHRFHAKKLAAAILGAIVAVLIENVF
jgi:zinc transporter ZupT